MVSSSSGVLFNNQMDDFSIPNGTVNFFGLATSPLNYPQPGKKPLSSMSPSLVLDRHGRIRLIGEKSMVLDLIAFSHCLHQVGLRVGPASSPPLHK